jgi:DNA-binding NarL/FixJ family response regulator
MMNDCDTANSSIENTGSGSMHPKARLVLADDHESVLILEAQLLRAHFDVIATVTNGAALVEEVQRSSPDVVVLDIAMPQMDGIQAARELRRLGLQTKIVFLTVQESDAFVSAAKAAGASGYVLKKCMAKDLVRAVKKVIAGGEYFLPGLISP